MHAVPLPGVARGESAASPKTRGPLMSRLTKGTLLVSLTLALPASDLAAQGYRLRLDARAQAAAYRGVRADSVPVTDVVLAPTGGFQTTDGFFVRCPAGGTHCFFFRSGPYQQGGPLVTSADLTLWGLGAS